MRGKKGQSLIFEQVLLFAISVTIFLVSFAVFNIYQNFYISVNSVNHLDGAKEWISANILKVAEKGNATSLLIIPIPRTIGDAVYEVKLVPTGLSVRNLLTGATENSTLYTLNQSFALSGAVTSIKGKITIKKEGNQIIIV